MKKFTYMDIWPEDKFSSCFDELFWDAMIKVDEDLVFHDIQEGLIEDFQ